MALKEINEQNLKKIQDLQSKLEELENENEHLGQEHLAMLKKQEQLTMKDYSEKKEAEQSTMADTRTNSNITMTNDEQKSELNQIAAVKDK